MTLTIAIVLSDDREVGNSSISQPGFPMSVYMKEAVLAAYVRSQIWQVYNTNQEPSVILDKYEKVKHNIQAKSNIFAVNQMQERQMFKKKK